MARTRISGRSYRLQLERALSDLRESSVHEQLDSRDVAGVVGGEKHGCLGDLFGRSKPAERSGSCDELSALIAHLRRGQKIGQARRLNGFRTDRVHANLAVLQVRGPGAREGARDGLTGGVDAVGRQSLLPTIDEVRMIAAPSGSKGSAFCTVKSRPLTLMLNISS